MTPTTHEPTRTRPALDDPAGNGHWVLARLPEPARLFGAAAWERRGRLALFVAGVAVIAVVVSLLLPKWYMAQSTILPPTEGGESFGMMSALIENTALNKLGLFSATTPSDVYVEILKSRTLRESLVRSFDLVRLYRTRGMDH